jgi:steroid delta-isomerase-like uncharacterized protein
MKRQLISTAAIFLALAGCSTAAQLQATQPEQVAQTSTQASSTTTSSGTLTPAENNKIAERMFEGAWNQGNFAVVDELVAPTALDHSPLGTGTGSEDFKHIIGTFRSAMPDLKMTIEDEVYSGDRVVHRWKIVGKHTAAPLFGVAADGKEITLTGITIVRMQDGKIAERWTQLDQLGLMQQLGLAPKQ